MIFDPSQQQSATEVFARLKHALLDRIWGGLMGACLVTAPFSIVHVLHDRNHHGTVWHLIVLSISLAMVLKRGALSVRAKVSILLLSCAAVAAFGFTEFGLLGAEWFYAVLAVIVAGMVLSKRATLVVWGGAMVMLATFMVVYQSGAWTPRRDIELYHASYEPWLLLMLASVIVPAFVLGQYRRNQDTLKRLLHEVERQRDIIAEQAYIDELTGVPARRLLMDRLDMAIGRVKRTEDLAAVLFLDLDCFKRANDQFGHAAGDEVLREVGRRLPDVLRSDDTVARYGGDEFVVILNSVRERACVRRVAERIIKAIEQPVLYEGHKVYVSASVGMRLFTHDEQELSREALLIEADEAMYRAKIEGKAQAVFFQDSASSRSCLA